MNKLRDMLTNQKAMFKEFWDKAYEDRDCCTCVHCFNPDTDDYDVWSKCDIYNKICAMCETCIFYEPKERRI